MKRFQLYVYDGDDTMMGYMTSSYDTSGEAMISALNGKHIAFQIFDSLTKRAIASY